MDIKDLENTISNKKIVINNNRKQSIDAILESSTKLRLTLDTLQKTLNSSLGFTSLRSLYDNESLIRISKTYSNPQYQKILNNITTDLYLNNISPIQSKKIQNTLEILSKEYLTKKTINQNFNFEHLNNFLNQDIYKIISNLQNSPFISVESISSIIDFEKSESNSESTFELATEITDEIASVDDYNLLSSKAKNVLIKILLYVILPYLISNAPSPIEIYTFVSEVTAPEYTNAQNDIKTVSGLHSQHINQKNIKYFRIITAHNINFRKAPSMQSEIITTLPIYKLIKVIDKTNKSWLLVRADIDGQIVEGWVIRRYTDNLR